MEHAIDDVISALRITEPEFVKEFREHAEVLNLKKGDFIVEEGRYIKKLAFVISGQVRVWQSFQEKEIYLYTVKPVQTCVLSLSACLEDYLSKVSAAAEGDSMVVTIPTRHVNPWQGRYASWDRFLIQTYKNSYDELLDLLYSLAFKKLDQRLVEYLEQKAQHNSNNGYPW